MGHGMEKEDLFGSAFLDDRFQNPPDPLAPPRSFEPLFAVAAKLLFGSKTHIKP